MRTIEAPSALARAISCGETSKLRSRSASNERSTTGEAYGAGSYTSRMRFGFGRTSCRGSPLTPTIVRRVRVFFVTVPVLIACVALFFIVMGTREWMLAVNSESWPTVDGTVVVSSVIESRHHSKSGTRTEYIPKVEYSYEHAGVRLSGSRISFRVISRGRADAQAIVDAYPVGASVVVHCDPIDHSRAVLSPGADWMSVIPVGVGVFCLGFCVFFLYMVRIITRRMLAALGEPPTTPRGAPRADETLPPQFNT